MSITLNGWTVQPTIFPDKTSQVWKLPPDALKRKPYKLGDIEWAYIIKWDFENEGEFLQVMQLAQLVAHTRGHIEGAAAIILELPYLPYARQDKRISNESTFALNTFINSVRPYFTVIKVLDAHNPNILPENFINEIPNERIKEVITKSDADIVCFPDKGATTRGYDTQDLPYFHLTKKRNQLTGEIEGLACELPLDLSGKRVLLVDDIADGSRTFIEAAKILKWMGATEIYLYTTHGLYTKGTKIIFEAGIDRIFNYKHEVKRGESNE